MIEISKYWQNQLNKDRVSESCLKEGRTFEYSNGQLGCNECCNGDRCDDSTHHNRSSCPYCLGSGRNKSCFI